jgi:predicted RNase H-like HicB family nuclease
MTERRRWMPEEGFGGDGVGRGNYPGVVYEGFPRSLDSSWVLEHEDFCHRLQQKETCRSMFIECFFVILSIVGVTSMTFYTFEIVVEKETEDEGYFAYSPTLPGCHSNGKTIEDAKRNIREAIQQHIQSLLAHQQPIPQNEKLVHVEELTVGVP